MSKYELIGGFALVSLLAVGAYATGYLLDYKGRPGLVNKSAEVGVMSVEQDEN